LCEINDRNQLEKQFISSQAFHQTPGGHVQEITTGERFEPRIIESFNLVIQEQYWVHLQTPSKSHENHSLTWEPKQTSLASFSHNQKELQPVQHSWTEIKTEAKVLMTTWLVDC
jgi:hypothetical protein